MILTVPEVPLYLNFKGTLTVGDQEVIKQLALDSMNVNYNPTLRGGAVSVVRW